MCSDLSVVLLYFSVFKDSAPVMTLLLPGIIRVALQSSQLYLLLCAIFSQIIFMNYWIIFLFFWTFALFNFGSIYTYLTPFFFFFFLAYDLNPGFGIVFTYSMRHLLVFSSFWRLSDALCKQCGKEIISVEVVNTISFLSMTALSLTGSVDER